MARSENFLEGERRELLATLIPPLVHRMNNSLAVISGLHETVDPVLGEGAFNEEMERITAALRHLAVLAKSHTTELHTFDLGEILEAVDLLGTPLAHQLGVDFGLRRPQAAQNKIALRSDARHLEQMVVTLTCGLISALRSTSETGPRVPLRLSLLRGRGRLALSLCHGQGATESGRPADMSDLLESVAPWAQGVGVGLSLRHMGRASCYRIAFGDVDTGSDLDESASTGVEEAAPTRLLLVVPDEPMRELLGALLGDAGYRVEVLSASAIADELPSREAALLLLDMDAELASPGCLERVVRAENPPLKVLLLGTSETALRADLPFGVRQLDKPFRPQELLAALEDLL